MRKILPAGLLLALLVLTGLWFRERQKSALLRQQNAESRQQANEARAVLDAQSGSLQQQANQLQKLQEEKAEAVRLRGEVSRLRQQLQLKEAELARRAAATANMAAASTNSEASSPVQSFSAQVRATLAWNQTLVTGGWPTEPGKHCFVLVDAQKIPLSGEENEPQQLEIRTKYLELPDALVTRLGLANVVTDKNETQGQATLTREQAAAIFEAIKDQSGVDLLSAPTITTVNNREAQIKSVDVFKTPDGQEHELGPAVNVVPHIPVGGESVLLSVTAQLKRRAK